MVVDRLSMMGDQVARTRRQGGRRFDRWRELLRFDGRHDLLQFRLVRREHHETLRFLAARETSGTNSQ